MYEVNKITTPDFTRGLLRYDNISVRRFNRLSESNKATLREFNLLPDQLSHVLKLYHYIPSVYSMPQEYNIRFAVNALYATYSSFLDICHLGSKRKAVSDKILLRELKFRGFVKLTRLLKVATKTTNSLALEYYIVCNRRLFGDVYVYPALMGDTGELPDWNSLGKYIVGALKEYMQFLSNPKSKVPRKLGSITPEYSERELKIIDKLFA